MSTVPLSRLIVILPELIDRCDAIIQDFESARNDPDYVSTPESWAQLSELSPTLQGIADLCRDVGLADGVVSFREFDDTYCKLLHELGIGKSVRNLGPRPIAWRANWYGVYPLPELTEEGRIEQNRALDSLEGMFGVIRRSASSLLEFIRSYEAKSQNGDVANHNGREALGNNAQELGNSNNSLQVSDDSSVLIIGPGYRSVVWRGDPYTFTKNQARAIEMLVDDRERGLPGVAEAEILKFIDSESPNLRGVFREKEGYHPAWDKLIVKLSRRDMFQLDEQIVKFDRGKRAVAAQTIES